MYTKIRAFTKADEVTPSSFIVPGHRKWYALPLPKRKPPRSKWTIYCEPCRDHDHAPTLPLDTFGISTNPGDIYANHLGRRRYCIICWLPVGDFIEASSEEPTP